MIDKRDIIELRIFQLLDSEDKWWTIEDIGHKLFLSKATIQKYLALLDQRICVFSHEEIFLEKSPSKGNYLHRSPSFDTQLVYTSILKEQLVFSIFTAFFNRDSVPLLQMAMDNFSSVASVRRKYQMINRRFRELGMGISITKDHLIGNEQQIRWFYSKFYWKIFKGNEWPFTTMPQEIVTDKLKKMQESFSIEFIPEVREELTYWVVVNWSRYRRKKYVLSDLEIKKYCLQNILFPYFIEVLGKIFPFASSENNEVDENEVYYLFFLLSALPVMEKNENFSNQMYLSHQKSNTIMYQLTKEWLFLFEKRFGYLESQEKWHTLEHELLQIHSYSYLFYAQPNMIFEEYKGEIYEVYPKFQEAVMSIYEALNPKYTSILKNKEYILERYSHVISPLINMNQFENTVRICLSFSKGKLYERIAQEKIITRFGKKYKLTFTETRKEMDLFISDLPQSKLLESNNSVSVLPSLTERDCKHIEITIQNILK